MALPPAGTPLGVPTSTPARRLAPVLGVTAVVLLTVSCITPASTLFIIVPELLATQGSGVVLALVLGVVISVAVGACYAELGTRSPSSGGEYVMVTSTLGRTLGWLTFALTAALLVVIPPIIALGTADYLTSIVDLDRSTTGAVVLLLAAATAILDIRANAVVTSAFLALEVVTAGVVAGLGFSHAQRPAGTLLHPQALVDGSLSPFSLAVLVAGLTTSMLIVNGFGTASYLAEEMVHPRRDVARAVFWSIAVGSVVILVPTAAVVLGAGDLTDLRRLTIPDFVTSWAGPGVSAGVSAGIAVAILNAVIVMVLQNGRVLYASGRDRAWPSAVNRALSWLHPRFGSPVVATLVVAVPGAVLAYVADIESLVSVTSVIVAVVYLLLAFAALRVRRRPHRGWKMPLWPLAPVLVVLALTYAIAQSASRDLLITGGILLAALVYEVAYLRPRRATRFLVDARDDR
ncbi:APC family permease [Kineococcus sp. DHX-1]|uniref:APC family permease n=1 Tax=Kineococcus sp. DHX-1 TaxID=3349638 RepID=UPI0036D27B1E